MGNPCCESFSQDEYCDASVDAERSELQKKLVLPFIQLVADGQKSIQLLLIASHDEGLPACLPVLRLLTEHCCMEVGQRNKILTFFMLFSCLFPCNAESNGFFYLAGLSLSVVCAAYCLQSSVCGEKA